MLELHSGPAGFWPFPQEHQNNLLHPLHGKLSFHPGLACERALEEGRPQRPGLARWTASDSGTSLPRPGDVLQKPYVSGEADVASRELTGSEDYLLLACDGFFDVVSPQEVAGLVHSHLARQQGSGLHVAEELVAAARERGSHDNITVMVVFLRDPRDLLEGCAQGAGESQADGRSQDVPSALSEPENNTPWRS